MVFQMTWAALKTFNKSFKKYNVDNPTDVGLNFLIIEK